MDNLSVRWGATLPITVENNEDTADTATLTVSKDDVVVFTKTDSFVDGVADVSMEAGDTELDLGIYDYMITIEYTDGVIEKYPDAADCTNCELPTIEICDSNDNTEVS